MFGVDRHLYPVELTSSNNTIVWTESGTRYERSVAPGLYYLHADGGFPSYLPGLVSAVLIKLAEPAGWTYTAAAATPSGSDLTNSGMEITNSIGTPWAWAFGDAAFTLDPRLLGYPSDVATAPAEALSQQGPHSLYGVWQSSTIFSTGDALDKASDTAIDSAVSTDDLGMAYQLDFRETEERSFDYREVPAGHVKRERAESGAYAEYAGLPDGDTHNQIYDLWYTARDLATVVTVHDQGDAPDAITSPSSYGWEAWKLQSAEVRARFSKFAERTDKGPERYRARWTGELIESHYDGVA